VADAVAVAPPGVHGVLEAALYADDLTAAKAFYAGKLGFETILEIPGTFVFFRCGTTILLVFNPEQTRKQPLPPPSRPVPGHGCDGAGHVCFAAPGATLDRWAEYLGKAGIPIEAEVTWDNGARSIYFRDPAGNSLEFAQPRLWGYQEGDAAA
jgi:catechol 2,3-dioxygenase-like lactoylglutathione lyase family enzyme